MDGDELNHGKFINMRMNKLISRKMQLK